MLMLLERMGYGSITSHGMRAAFKTWADERTNFPEEVRDAALAHVVSDGTKSAYSRGTFLEKRRQLMAAWASFLSKPVKASGDNVVAIKQ